jgi:two-component system, chemotaxis family, protein-glutamate methylesterase/glutaminase
MKKCKMKRDIIVIGASAGGLNLFRQILAGLPDDFNASIFIVWHMSPEGKSLLPELLASVTSIPVATAVDKEPIVSGRIYIAPQDCHMILELNVVRVTHGPKENLFRPAIDPLFRSAASIFGTRVIGVILSGGLDDGSSGLYSIKRMGGMAIVQDPATAENSAMPLNASRITEPDYMVNVREIPGLLAKLSAETVEPLTSTAMNEKEKMDLEVRVAAGNSPLKQGLTYFDNYSPYTCPECKGTLSEVKEGKIVRFRCHTGHAFSALSLLSALDKNIEGSLWTTVRAMEESFFLLRQMADQMTIENNTEMATVYFEKAKKMEARKEHLRKIVLRNTPVSPEKEIAS